MSPSSPLLVFFWSPSVLVIASFWQKFRWCRVKPTQFLLVSVDIVQLVTSEGQGTRGTRTPRNCARSSYVAGRPVARCGIANCTEQKPNSSKTRHIICSWLSACSPCEALRYRAPNIMGGYDYKSDLGCSVGGGSRDIPCLAQALTEGVDTPNLGSISAELVRNKVLYEVKRKITQPSVRESVLCYFIGSGY